MNQQQSKREIARRFFLHDPATMTRSYVDWARRLQVESGITYGCALDRTVIPLHPGDLMAVVARPGHGKTSFMAYMARKTALDIVKRGAAEKECVVYVSWEQTVEEIDAMFQSGADYSSTDMAWGRVPMSVIEQKAVKRAGLPVWAFGESKRHEGITRPRMTVDYVYESIEAMQDEFGIKPVLMCLDYVQIMPVLGRGEKMERVDEAINEAKQLAVRMGLPIIIGVQSTRAVDDYKDPIPTMKDAQWSSAIEQVADKQISLWRPIKTHDPEDKPTVDIGGVTYRNDENLLIIKLLKQRFGQGYGIWAVRFVPQTLEMNDYQTVSLNGRK